jgi:hypothetical protein
MVAMARDQLSVGRVVHTGGKIIDESHPWSVAQMSAATLIACPVSAD